MLRVEAIGLEIRVSGHLGEHDTVDPEVKDKGCVCGGEGQQMQAIPSEVESKVPNDTCLGFLEVELMVVSTSSTDR